MVETRRQKHFELKKFGAKKIWFQRMMQQRRLNESQQHLKDIGLGLIIIPISLQTNNNTIIVANALLDCGATDNLINSTFAKEFNIPLQKERKKIGFLLADGSMVSSVSRKTREIKSRVGNKISNIKMTSTCHVSNEVVLGIPWLRDNKPNIDWENPTKIESWFI